MGYDLSNVEIPLRKSNHNSYRDDRDRILIKDLVDRIAAIVNEPQYQDIVVFPLSYGDAEQPSWMPSPMWTVPLDNDQLNEMDDLQRRR